MFAENSYPVYEAETCSISIVKSLGDSIINCESITKMRKN